VRIFAEAGYEVHRCPIAGALMAQGDLIGTEYVVECKRCETVRLVTG